MKPTHILAASIAALCLGQSASAANVTVRIVGSTAFRAATTNAIKNVLNNPAISYTGGSSFSGATYATFVGTLATVPSSTVTVKCSWGGSVDGIRDVAGNLGDIFLADGVASATGSGSSIATITGNSETVAPDIAMADNLQSSTIYKTPALAGNGTPVVGVVPFSFVKSRGTPASITNLTRQQFKWLFTNAYAPTYLWTGNFSDKTPIWAFGRDPFSGTRLTALAETQYGTTTVVSQFHQTATTGTGVTAAITDIDQTANGGTVGGISLDDGNNGEASGGSNADNMRFLSSSVTDSFGVSANVYAPATAGPAGMITYLGEADANRAVYGLSSTTGYNTNSTGTDRAAYLSYEGVFGFQGEAKNSVVGTITGGNTLTITSVGPGADTNHQGATTGATGLVVGQIVSGTGITPGSVIATITLPNIITLDKTQTNGSVSGLIISSFIPELVRNGQYPFWNYEQMLWKAGTAGVNIVGTSGDKFEVAKAVRDNIISTAYTFSGLDVASMKVQRFLDGGPISPKAFGP